MNQQFFNHIRMLLNHVVLFFYVDPDLIEFHLHHIILIVLYRYAIISANPAIEAPSAVSAVHGSPGAAPLAIASISAKSPIASCQNRVGWREIAL